MTLYSEPQPNEDSLAQGVHPWLAIDPSGARFGAALEPAGPGHPVIAWAVILSMLTLSLVLAGLARRKSPAPTAVDQGLSLQAKYLVGAAEMVPAASLEDAIRNLNRGPIAHRLRAIIVAAELRGPEEGVELLDQLIASARGAGVTPTQVESQQIDQLQRLFHDYSNQRWNAPEVTSEERESLHAQLGWFGELALNPKQAGDAPSREAVLKEARHTVTRLLATGFAAVMLGLLGLITAAIVVGILVGGVARRRFKNRSKYGGVYVEAFAVWLVAELIVGLASGLVVPQMGLLGVLALTLLAAAVPLAWPLIRGVSWKTLRRDVGLVGGRNPLTEMFCGLVTYLATLPALALSLIAVFILQKLGETLGLISTDEFAPPDVPSHPITEWLAQGGWAAAGFVLLLAVVVAPIVEEFLFRGLLYRHLREATRRWRVALSVLASAVISSLIFAAMHPQGWLGIPPLMTLAVCFCLAREWRQSLLAPMTAHAVNNLVVTVVLLVLF